MRGSGIELGKAGADILSLLEGHVVLKMFYKPVESYQNVESYKAASLISK